MDFDVQLAPAAQRQLKRLPKQVINRIVPKIKALSQEPRPQGVVKLRGSAGRWRIRVGEYRIVYRIEDDNRIVIVLVIGHRREVYT